MREWGNEGVRKCGSGEMWQWGNEGVRKCGSKEMRE